MGTENLEYLGRDKNPLTSINGNDEEKVKI
jgi:hypothetical protein